MKNGDEIMTLLSKKFSEQELDRVFYLIRHDLPKVYVLPFFMTLYQVLKRGYMIATTILMLLMILFFDWELYTFFVPLIPIVFVNVFAFVESNIITYRMNKVHNQLIGENIQIQWDEVMDIVMIIIIEDFLKGGDENNNKINTI